MNNIIGKEVRVYYSNSTDYLDGVVRYQPLKSQECWIIETKKCIHYIKNFDSMVLEKETTDEDR